MKNNTTINSKWIIYMLVWFFLGIFGVHRFVAGKIGTGILMLSLQIIGRLTLIILIGLPILGIAWIWWLVDGIMIAMSKFEEKGGNIIQMNIKK